MTSPYPIRICKSCRKEGRREKVETISGYCFREPHFCYQKFKEAKTKIQVEKQQERQKKYLAKALAKQKEKAIVKRDIPSVRIELHGEEYTLKGKLIEQGKVPGKARTLNKDKSISELIKLATEVFNRWIRERDCVNGYGHCISCNDVISYEEGHAGHFWPAGSNGVVRFDEINVALQCVNCNINLNGNQTEYLKGLYRKYGSAEVESLAVRAKAPFKWDRATLLEIIETYKNKSKLSKAS